MKFCIIEFHKLLTPLCKYSYADPKGDFSTPSDHSTPLQTRQRTFVRVAQSGGILCRM